MIKVMICYDPENGGPGEERIAHLIRIAVESMCEGLESRVLCWGADNPSTVATWAIIDKLVSMSDRRKRAVGDFIQELTRPRPRNTTERRAVV